MTLPEFLRLLGTFTWWGMVLAISGLEAPLKFRAPGITVPLGLGIGRLVFRALNIAELVWALLITVALLVPPSEFHTGATSSLVLVLWLLLVVQLGFLRPKLDRRALALIAGETPPASRGHLVYIALEGLKIIVLPVLGVLFWLDLPVR
ncbi:hypothetical protein [Pseudonocardia spinosispora]|uniref:hypothetical protein n=1 Tax=Pseudonocardia spinosispora TaxID=103441 RepID=UPI00042508A1